MTGAPQTPAARRRSAFSKASGVCGAFFVGLFALSAGHAAAPLPRVASASVCADQYLLTLAAPAQIAALSADARNPALSAFAERAQDFPVVRGNAEELIAIAPNILLSEPYMARDTARLLARQGVRVVSLPVPETLDGVAAALRSVGRLIGRAEAGEVAAAAFETRRRALLARRKGNAPAGLYLLPTGTTAGRGTFIDEILTTGGLNNYAAVHGHTGWSRIALETVVTQPPAVLVLGFFDRAKRSVVAGFASSPVFARTLATAPHINVPNALWICPGPMNIAASELIARARHQIHTRKGTDP